MSDVNFQTLVTGQQQTVLALNAIAKKIGNAFTGQPLSGSKTYDPANLTTLTQDTTTVTVAGAVLGGYVEASFSLSLVGIALSGYVSAADTVTVVFFNGTAGTINLASGMLRVRVWGV